MKMEAKIIAGITPEVMTTTAGNLSKSDGWVTITTSAVIGCCSAVFMVAVDGMIKQKRL
jgi:hypothetical protein